MPIKTEELKEIALKQIELLNSDADVLKSSQQLSEKQIDELLSHVQQVQQKLSVLKFMLELPDGEEVVVTQNAVELNSEKEEKPAQHESIMHQVDDFEESIAEDAEEVKEDQRSEPESETLSEEKPEEQKAEPVEEKKEEEIEEEEPKADSEDSAEKTEDRSEEKSEKVEGKSAEKGSDQETEQKSTIEDSTPTNNSLADYLGSKRIDDRTLFVFK
jgi:outer membrane biosynthesis protein TonB